VKCGSDLGISRITYYALCIIHPLNNQPYDVLIAGGGPGGCATALSLRVHAPSLSVVLVEASHYDQPRLGETLSPLAQRLLEQLGVWDAFRVQGHQATYGAAASWGTPALHENDFIYSTHGVGWHLDRMQFDAMLAEQAEHQGVCLLRGTRVELAEADGASWRVCLSSGVKLHTRFVVDATGRRAVIARRHGAHVITLDHLAGFAQFFSETTSSDPRTLVEAFHDGWWYTAGLPAGQRVVVCMTDSDIARSLRLTDPASWFQLLGKTTHTQEAVRTAIPRGPLLVRPTESRYLEPASAASWLAVGDAASIFDPLSSQGIIKALRSGIFASYAIADFLLKGVDDGLQRYRLYVQEEFANYASVRAKYYQAEQRWPASEFWRRRLSG
jgi:2-polyprenyl-6-methoxyphenol hydroxylase-like FAD-dependent oxidoreductase